MLEPGKILDTLGAGIFGIAGLENVVISEGTRPPDPWGSPGISPKSGDGVGTGTGFENLRGRGGDGES